MIEVDFKKFDFVVLKNCEIASERHFLKKLQSRKFGFWVLYFGIENILIKRGESVRLTCLYVQQVFDACNQS